MSGIWRLLEKAGLISGPRRSQTTQAGQESAGASPKPTRRLSLSELMATQSSDSSDLEQTLKEVLEREYSIEEALRAAGIVASPERSPLDRLLEFADSLHARKRPEDEIRARLLALADQQNIDPRAVEEEARTKGAALEAYNARLEDEFQQYRNRASRLTERLEEKIRALQEELDRNNELVARYQEKIDAWRRLRDRASAQWELLAAVVADAGSGVGAGDAGAGEGAKNAAAEGAAKDWEGAEKAAAEGGARAGEGDASAGEGTETDDSF